MDYPESIKALIYNQLLHFFHLQEQRLELELKEIKEFVQLHQLKGVLGSLSTIHVLDCIGNHEPINHSAIVDKLNLSKASITKINKKLLALNLINRTQLNDNRKEVYFRLTSLGKKLFEMHRALHEAEEQNFIRFLDSYSDSEHQTILKFFQGMNRYIGER
ncbi:MarR family transcriptional regulator [Paenibacillus oryzisoli]|uniref:MarR family transcriptional regulator n=1 Tax=Paenibacillus oryzisoli TaxID=1850517 RepID=A0A198AC44_9BACL|nr:MarR family transcriptional regulator [Paenibacillus oryzisoli]OAS18670.1 MarR family transcriptional regulator [Paenibacillus oryzisoli]